MRFIIIFSHNPLYSHPSILLHLDYKYIWKVDCAVIIYLLYKFTSEVLPRYKLRCILVFIRIKCYEILPTYRKNTSIYNRKSVLFKPQRNIISDFLFAATLLGVASAPCHDHLILLSSRVGDVNAAAQQSWRCRRSNRPI